MSSLPTTARDASVRHALIGAGILISPFVVWAMWVGSVAALASLLGTAIAFAILFALLRRNPASSLSTPRQQVVLIGMFTGFAAASVLRPALPDTGTALGDVALDTVLTGAALTIGIFSARPIGAAAVAIVDAVLRRRAGGGA